MPLQPAILGTARLNNFRLGYVPAALVPVRTTRIQIWLDGALATGRVRREGFTIHDLLNDSPNTCTLTIEGTPPPEEGMALRVTINSDAPRVLFAGTLQVAGETFDGRPSQLAYPCRAVDDTGRINKRRPFGTFVNVSATTVAQTLVAQFAPGFSAAGVAAALPTVTITFDGSLPFMGCLARLAKLIGGYCNVDDGVVALFLGGAVNTTPLLPPAVLVAAGSGIDTGIHQWAYTFATALGETIPSPAATRAVGGNGVTPPPTPGYAATDAQQVPGDPTFAVIGDTFEWFCSYSKAIGSLDVTQESTRGTTTGAIALVAGSLGAPNFRQPFVTVTASADPSVRWIHVWARRNGGAYYLAIGGAVANNTASLPFQCTLYDGGPYSFGSTVTPPLLGNQAALSAIAVGPAAVTGRKVYRTVAGGSQLKLQQTIGNNTATTGTDATPDASLGANAPTTDTSGLAVDPDAPNPIAAGYPFLHDPPITATRDDSQLATRVYGKGHAEALLIDVAASETILPVADGVMYNPGGGQVITSTTPDGAVSEILGYRGVILPGPGTIVGSGASPSVAPALAPADGAGLTAGTYRYAYTDVTPSGESLPSPLGTIVLGGNVTDPTAFPTVSLSNAGAATYPIAEGGTYTWCYTFSTALGESLPSPVWTVKLNPGPTGGPFHASVGIPAGPAGTTGRKVYRTTNGGLTLKLSGTVANNTALAYDDQTLDGALGAGVPTVNAAVKGLQVAISGVGLGGGATTARKVYRTVVNGAQLKLQQTIGNNTATTGTDATPDASLGANAPATDTSGLTQPVGQILGGSTTIPTVGLGTLPAAGWVRSTAGDLIRYTGATGNALTGIPATGAGAIVTTILYGDVLVAAPALTGVTGLTKALAKGAPVHLWVQRDDLAAQAAAAARESTDTYPSDGVHELTISDARLAETTLNAWCDAQLALFADPIVTVAYATRDVKTKSGKSVTISLTSPAINDTLTIQEVTITEMDVAPGTPPRFTVLASSVRFSLEDTLRRLSSLLET